MDKESLIVNEIFFSIQGESSYCGKPCAFVRLTACNLRCSYCDTEYAFYEGEKRSVQDVVAEIKHFRCSLVEITGGEPLLQPAVHGLISRFLTLGKTVLIETSGSVDISPVDARAILIYDIKCPDSGMEDRNRWENIGLLKPIDEVKFVVGSKEDYEWSKCIIEKYQLVDRHQVLFSPVFGKIKPKELATWLLEDSLNARLQIQLHKLLWSPQTRGV